MKRLNLRVKIILSFGSLLVVALLLLTWLTMEANRKLAEDRQLMLESWNLGHAFGSLGASDDLRSVDVAISSLSSQGGEGSQPGFAEAYSDLSALAGRRKASIQAQEDLSGAISACMAAVLDLALNPPEGIGKSRWDEIVLAAAKFSGKIDQTNFNSLKSLTDDIIDGSDRTLAVNLSQQSRIRIDNLLTLSGNLVLLEEKSRLAVQDLTAAAAISSRHPGVQLGTVLAHGPRIAIGLFILFILSALLFFTLNRTLIKPLQHIHGWLDQSAIDVTKTAVSLSRSSRSLARGASDNTKAVLDAISSLDVLLNTAKRNAGHAGQAKELMDRAKSFVDAAHLTMQQISAAMEEIKNSGQASSQIVKTVDEIAFQTNILALNAAVEAARAGEAGVGFAVVADEVRNLANSSSAAAKSTTSMLESSLERIQEGADLVRKAEESFESLVTTSDEAAALMRGITEDSQSQTRDIQDVHQSIALMDKVTQENSLEAAEAGNISSELNRQAELLNKTISQVARVVSGRRAGLSGVRRGNFGQARPREGSAGSAGRAGVSKAPGERSGGAAAAAGKQGEVPGSFIDQILSEEKQHSSLPTKAFGKPKRSDLEKALPMDDDF